MQHVAHDNVLLVAFACWTVAQVLKVAPDLWKKHRLNLRMLVSAGGMPSSHSALVCALATGVALREGLYSSAFAICVVLAAVIMYDAAGVRRAASIQAHILNQIIDELFQGHPISEEKLKELLGHTPVEVLAGAALGIGLTWLWMQGWRWGN